MKAKSVCRSLLPLGVPRTVAPAMLHTESQDRGVRRALITTSDVGSIAQGPGVLDHQV